LSPAPLWRLQKINFREASGTLDRGARLQRRGALCCITKTNKDECSSHNCSWFNLKPYILTSNSEFPPAWAWELQQKVVTISSASDEELGKAGEAPASNIPPLEYSGSSSKPAAALMFTCGTKNIGTSQYEEGAVAYYKKGSGSVCRRLSPWKIKSGATHAPRGHHTWGKHILILGKAKTYLVHEKGHGHGHGHGEVLTQGMVSIVPARMRHLNETIGDQTAVLSLYLPARFKTFDLGDSLIRVKRNVKDCASSSITPCGAKRKSLILIAKDELMQE